MQIGLDVRVPLACVPEARGDHVAAPCRSIDNLEYDVALQSGAAPGVLQHEQTQAKESAIRARYSQIGSLTKNRTRSRPAPSLPMDPPKRAELPTVNSPIPDRSTTRRLEGRIGPNLTVGPLSWSFIAWTRMSCPVPETWGNRMSSNLRIQRWRQRMACGPQRPRCLTNSRLAVPQADRPTDSVNRLTVALSTSMGRSRHVWGLTTRSQIDVDD